MANYLAPEDDPVNLLAARMNPNLAAQGLRGRQNMAAPDSVMDPRYAAWKKSQDDAELLGLMSDMAMSAVPLAGPAARGAMAAGRSLAPTAGRMTENYMLRSGMMLPLDTWHGSPHRFPPTAKNPLGEFDASKIGTGQGAQTYGHGLYVAENPKVAGGTEYRDPQGMFNRLAGGMNNREEFAHDMISQGRKPAEVFQIMKQKYGQFFNDRMLWADLDKVSSARGNLYKVDLADEQIPKMLDWDKPFNKQHPEVQQALVNIANSQDEGSKMLKLMQDGNPSGKNIFHSLLTEPQLIDSPNGWISVDNKKEISKLLQQEGIPGIRYLDQGSRAGGAGTSNFVVFDPKHMNIIGRE